MEPNEPLVIKVMRLRQPQAEAPRPMADFRGLGVSDVPKLLLPMSLTQSLVGEPFAGYLHLSNVSSLPVNNVTLKVELQAGSAAKVVLFNNTSSPISAIEADDFFDTNVEHDLHDAGTYVLTCNVTYSVPGISEPGLLKRSYRFPALHPFAVAHRVAQMDTQFLVECVVENATTGCIYLASWRFDCADGFEVSLVSGGSSGSSAKGDTKDCSLCSEGGDMHLLKARGSHSLVFRVSPKSEAIDVAYVRALEHVGTLALGWHVPDGPSGCAENHQVRLKPSAANNLDLLVVACPRQVRVEESFRLEMEVVNRASRAVEPSIVFDLRLMGPLKIHGASQIPVGRLEAYCTTRVPLDVLIAVPGMYPLKGISLVDELSHTKIEFTEGICDILAF